VLLSRSGLTRLVDRLAADGLVDREPCPDDARGTFTVITEAGLDRMREAAPTHLQGIEEHVTSKLTPAELDTFGKLLRKLLTPADAEAEPTDCGLAESVAMPAPAVPASSVPASSVPASSVPASSVPAG
jgi:MarR family